MAIQTVLRMGDPRLLERAGDVEEFDTRELHALVEDMLETMAEKKGAGIAAPQIGVGRRVVIFGIDGNLRYPHVEPVPLTVLINPVIEPLSEELEEGWEGCLSVPGLRGQVARFRCIRYEGYDVHGNHIRREAEGFHARVVQHECDHLDGVLYPQRIRDMTRFGFIEELAEAGLLPVVKGE